MTTIFEIRATAPQDYQETKAKEVEAKNNDASNENKRIKKSDEVVKSDINKRFNKVVGSAAAIYGTSQMIIQPYTAEKINKASVAGDYITARNISIRQQRINKAVGLGFDGLSILGASMINPATAIIAGGAVATKYITQTINRQQANRVIEATNNITNYLNSYESARMINVRAGR